MHQSVIDYVKAVVTAEMIQDKSVIEVGALDVCGSAQPFVKQLGPTSYVGIDLDAGPGVDLVWNAEKLLEKFPENSVDFILTNECMEHVEDWKKIILNFKAAVKPGGYILITTRSKGFPYHAWPYDFWRYSVQDMKDIFADFDVLDVRDDPETPGVFVLASKPVTPRPAVDLDTIKLYSIVKWKRLTGLTSAQITDWDVKRNRWYFSFRFSLANIFPTSLKQKIKGMLYGVKS